MGEQDNGRNHAGASDGQAAEGGPAEVGVGTAAVSGSSVRVGRAVQKVLNALAAIARLVGSLFAVVLLIRVGLAFVAVNPHNVIVEWIVGFSDAIVLDFRDLFLPSDPRIGLAVNYGLAAVFWLVAGMVVGWALSAVGQLAAGQPRL